jgi:hypothetical protein
MKDLRVYASHTYNTYYVDVPNNSIIHARACILYGFQTATRVCEFNTFRPTNNLVLLARGRRQFYFFENDISLGTRELRYFCFYLNLYGRVLYIPIAFRRRQLKPLK